jgi:hypothetical protein
MPRGWKKGDVWTLVTADGPVELRAKRYRLEQGAGEIHLVVELGRGARKQPDALAIRGTDVPPDLTFALAQPRDGSTLGDDAPEKVRTAVLSATKNRAARALFGKARIEPSHIRIHDARLPAPWTSVVFVDAPSREHGEPARASAMLFLADDGTLHHHAVPDVEGGQLWPHAILDIDGNGVDEIVYEDEYEEGAYELLLWFDGETPKRRVLTGDGA